MGKTAVNKRNVIIASVILFLCVIIFCATQFYDCSNLQTFHVAEADETNCAKWNIDKINCGNNYVIISGWAFVLKEAPERFNSSIVLKSTKTKNYIEIPTALVARADLNKVFSDGTDYTQSGFFSKVNKDEIDLTHSSYRVYIKYFNNNHHILIDTKRTLTNKLGDQ
ncbi:MAG: hypothetical protein LKJ17_11095 [Oscillospiraceae bacterium]|jgi:hypothetical protein|nr:hypothetical protein [Oscillospiraceae bacterium]